MASRTDSEIEPMFKTPDELKAFLVWCRDQKIQQIVVKDGEVQVVFSALALVPTSELLPQQDSAETPPTSY